MFGNIALFIPYNNAVKGEYTAIIIAFLIGILVYCFAKFGIDKYENAKTNKIIIFGVGAVLIGFCMLVSIATIKHFTDYVSADVLSRNRKIFSLIGFGAVYLFAANKEKQATAKFSGIVFVFSVVSMLLLLLASLGNFETSHLKTLVMGDIVGIAKRSIKYLFYAFLFPVVFGVFSAFSFKEKNIKSEVLGLIIGFLMLSVCFFSATLTFSLSEASGMEHAYPMSISVVSVGELFTRMDGFAYFIFFLSALVKAAICGLSIKAILEKMNVKRKKAILNFLLCLSVAIAYFV